jgi:uncharacterized protein
MRTVNARVQLPEDVIRDFCIRHRIQKLSLFGSVLTPRFRGDSDVDVLVEFEAGGVPGYFGLAGMEEELSDLLGRRVDLRTPEELSRYFRSRVLAEAAVQYERE